MRCSVPWQHGHALRRRLDDDIFARQMLRQTADVAHGLRARRSGPPRAASAPPAPVRSATARDPRARAAAARRRHRTSPSARQTGSASASPTSPAACRSRRAVRAIISIRMSGSRGREATSDAMHDRLPKHVGVSLAFNAATCAFIQLPSEARARRSASSPCRRTAAATARRSASPRRHVPAAR